MVFEPRPTALRGDRLSASAALAVTPSGSTNVVFGIARIEARVVHDTTRRQVTMLEKTAGDVRFAQADSASMAGLDAALKREFGELAWTMSSESLDSSLESVVSERDAARELKTTPPTILYSSTPAVLIVLDGPPQLRPLTNSPLMRVINTPYAMLFDPANKKYWLQGSYEWFAATDWRGEWSPVAQPPAEVAAAVPADAVRNAPPLGSQSGLSPRIVVSSEPAELIATRGEPTYTPIDGNELLYVSNSDQLLFLLIDGKEYYVTFSGRWYRSAALHGPWEAVAPDKLPAAFARIPPGSPKSEALTYVAGTTEAEHAVSTASIPQITAIDRGSSSLDVRYEGSPQFQAVANTTVQYATNTPDAVFLIRGAYYVCRDAVWYTGPSADGPWSVAAEVPTEIQSLPASHPHYNVKYVYVYGSTPETVYVGYLPGYAGCYVAGPTVVYGTGWWYPGYYGPTYYWAYPATFGFGFGYNSWSGWSVGLSFGYGWLSCGYGWGWGGSYPWGWWGPRGAYWACAPRYPRYDRGHRGYDSHNHGGFSRDGGPPERHEPGAVAGGRPGPRRDAPNRFDRPGNPQRRTLPTYARNARGSFQAPTNLGQTAERGVPARMSTAQGRSATPTPTSGTRSGFAPNRQATQAGARSPTARGQTTTSVPQRTARSPVSDAPVSRQRSSVPSTSVARTPTPGRTTTAANSVTRPQPTYGTSRQLPTASRPVSYGLYQGARSPSYATGPTYATRNWSSRPSYSGSVGMPSTRGSGAPFAPYVRGSAPSSLSSPMRAAPTQMAPRSSGGSMGRGGPLRGR